MIARFCPLTKAAVLLALSFPQLAAADTFTSATVLGWPEAQQNALFQTSITMTGIVATRRDDTSHIARCIDDWYSDAKGTVATVNASIRESMRQLSEYHPQAVIIAVVEKACGKFDGS